MTTTRIRLRPYKIDKTVFQELVEINRQNDLTPEFKPCRGCGWEHDDWECPNQH